MSGRGCEHNDVTTRTHHGLHLEGIVVPEVIAHVHMQMILVRWDKHHREVRGQCTPSRKRRRQLINISVPILLPTILPRRK